MTDALDQIRQEMSGSNFEQLDIDTANVYDSLSNEDFEQMESADYLDYMDYLDALEDAENKKRKKHRPLRLHRKHHAKHGQKKAHVKPLAGRTKLAAVGGGGTYKPEGATSPGLPTFGGAAYIIQEYSRSVGDLNLTISRPTANIAAPLPYILFDLNGYNSSYVSTLRQYLPAGVTVSAASDPLTGDVILTYTAPGPLVDTVRISLTGSPISYSEFLQSMSSNFFKTRYIRYEIPNDGNLLAQSSQPINFGLLSALGMQNRNAMLPRSRRMSSDYQTYIINLFIPNQKVTTDFSFVQQILPVAGYTVGWDIVMNERVNLNNM